LGIAFGLYLDHIKMPVLWKLKVKIIELKRIIALAVADKRIVKKEREDIHHKLMEIHQLTTTENIWEPIIAFLLAPYTICYAFVTDKKIMDCIFGFTLTRFFKEKSRRKTKEEIPDKELRDLSNDMLQSLEWIRRRIGMGVIAGYAALIAIILGTGLQQGIIDLPSLVRYFFLNLGMISSMAFLDIREERRLSESGKAQNVERELVSQGILITEKDSGLRF
jgi:hypothetical protein